MEDKACYFTEIEVSIATLPNGIYNYWITNTGHNFSAEVNNIENLRSLIFKNEGVRFGDSVLFAITFQDLNDATEKIFDLWYTKL